MTWQRFHITGPLWGVSSYHRWIPLNKGPVMRSFYVFFVFGSKQAVEQAVMLSGFERSGLSYDVTVGCCRNLRGQDSHVTSLYGGVHVRGGGVKWRFVKPLFMCIPKTRYLHTCIKSNQKACTITGNRSNIYVEQSFVMMIDWENVTCYIKLCWPSTKYKIKFHTNVAC